MFMTARKRRSARHVFSATAPPNEKPRRPARATSRRPVKALARIVRVERAEVVEHRRCAARLVAQLLVAEEHGAAIGALRREVGRTPERLQGRGVVVHVAHSGDDKAVACEILRERGVVGRVVAPACGVDHHRERANRGGRRRRWRRAFVRTISGRADGAGRRSRCRRRASRRGPARIPDAQAERARRFARDRLARKLEDDRPDRQRPRRARQLKSELHARHQHGNDGERNDEGHRVAGLDTDAQCAAAFASRGRSSGRASDSPAKAAVSRRLARATCRVLAASFPPCAAGC